MKQKYFFIYLFLVLIALHGKTLEAFHGQKKKVKSHNSKKHYCLYLDKKNGKEKALTIRIPDSFQDGIKFEELSIETNFLSNSDLVNNGLFVKEIISFREYPNVKIDEFIYGACISTCKMQNLDMILNHSVTFTHENGILAGTVFFDRPSLNYSFADGGFMGPANYELIFFKAFQGKDNILVVQYVKRYNYETTAEKKIEMIREIKKYLSENVFVSDFDGKVKRPDENVKIVPRDKPDKMEVNIAEFEKQMQKFAK